MLESFVYAHLFLSCFVFMLCFTGFLFFLGVVPIFWHNYSVYSLVFLLLCFV